MIELKDKSVGYQFSIEKGGIGSGITGHTTVHDAVANMSSQQRRSALDKLQAEKEKFNDGILPRFYSSDDVKSISKVDMKQFKDWSIDKADMDGIPLKEFATEIAKDINAGATFTFYGLTIEDKGEIKGLMSYRNFEYKDNSLRIEGFASKTPGEGGVGKAMMIAVAKIASEKNVGISLRSSKGAEPFYKKLGMTRQRGDLYIFTRKKVKEFVLANIKKSIGIDDEPENGIFTIMDKTSQTEAH